MGKSNNINHANNFQKNNFYNILNLNEITLLKEVNKKFTKKAISYFSDLLKNNINLNYSSIKINSYTNHDRHTKYLFLNSIEILNLKKKSFILFSDNFLSVFTDFLFGGDGKSIDKITKTRDLTYTEEIISHKVLKLILKAYCQVLRKIFFIDLKILDMKIINIKNFSFFKEKFITNYFNFNINHINVFLSILLPLSIIKKNFQKFASLDNTILKNKMLNIVKTDINLIDIYEVKLNIITKLILSSTVHFHRFSIGDILEIKNPDQIIAYIDNKPIFLGHYKYFNKNLVVFMDKFINKYQKNKNKESESE
ncbi:Flagellar motor switch protein FliM [Buchnera aphidicola (Protaphis terricola)]|uniref:hypothetical protein n=1 Tax=Buchnera aphidicola TaxID=9 RepID=UPI003463AEF9